ncbi:MAG TPA: FAD-dependent monooxygenase [Alphaproteobacteria bacterium]
MATAAPVVVVGAGPVGLVTALILARADVPVTVLEAESDLTRDLRAGSYHPPTLEMLAELGVVEAMHATGIIARHWQVRERGGRVIADFDLGLIASETPFPYRLHFEQFKLTPLLLTQLQSIPGARVRFGVRVESVSEDDSGVTVHATSEGGEETFRAAWVVGADGGRSTVRKAASIPFEGFTWPERFLVASTTYDFEPAGFRYASYVADPELWAAVFKVPHEGPPGLWRIAYPTDPNVPEEQVLADDAIEDNLQKLHPIPGRWPLQYRSTYRVHQRVAETFRKGRILLAGDAAHINNPLGGFGLNGGIHDAVSLGHKLAQVCRADADPLVLNLYDRQRRPTNVEFVQAMSIQNKRMIEERDPAVRARRRAELAETAADPVKAKAFLMNSSMITSVRNAASIL